MSIEGDLAVCDKDISVEFTKSSQHPQENIHILEHRKKVELDIASVYLYKIL